MLPGASKYVRNAFVAGSSLALSFLKKDGRILARGGVFVRLGEAGGVGRRALLFLPQILVVVVDVVFVVEEACS